MATIAIDDALHRCEEANRIIELLKAEGHRITDPLSDEPFDLLLHSKALNLPTDWKQIHKALRDGGYLSTTKYPCLVFYKHSEFPGYQDIKVMLTTPEIHAITLLDYSPLGLDWKQIEDLQIRPEYD